MSCWAPDPATCAEAAANRSYVGCDYWPVPLANKVNKLWDFAVIVANLEEAIGGEAGGGAGEVRP